MAKSRKAQRRKPPSFELFTKYELVEALKEKLTTDELGALLRQMTAMRQDAAIQGGKTAAEEAFVKTWAVIFHVLHTNFGWGRKRFRRLWDYSLGYLHDIDAKDVPLSVEEIRADLRKNCGIDISWHIRDEDIRA